MKLGDIKGESADARRTCFPEVAAARPASRNSYVALFSSHRRASPPLMAGGELYETVTLGFLKINIDYTPLMADGSAGAVVQFAGSV